MSGNEKLIEVAVETERRFSVLETQMTSIQVDHTEMKDMLQTLINNMNKNKGFWAGAVAAGTALGAALSYLVSYIFHIKTGS